MDTNPKPAPKLQPIRQVETEREGLPPLWQRVEPRSEGLQAPSPIAPAWQRQAYEADQHCSHCGRAEAPVCYGMCRHCVTDDLTRDSELWQARRGLSAGGDPEKR